MGAFAGPLRTVGKLSRGINASYRYLRVERIAG